MFRFAKDSGLMVVFLVVLVFLLGGSVFAFDPPPVTADPPPVVFASVTVNNTAPAQARPLVMTYRAIYERVTGGSVVFLAVGSDEPGYERVDDAPNVVKPGLYRCYAKDGVPTFERVEPVRKVVQAVVQTVGKATGRVAEFCLPGRH